MLRSVTGFVRLQAGHYHHKEEHVALAMMNRERTNVGTFERWLSMVAGGALAVYGLKRRDVPGGTAAVAGAALLYRGATGHCDVYQALGINRASRDGGAGGGIAADRGSDTRQQLGGPRGIHV